MVALRVLAGAGTQPGVRPGGRNGFAAGWHRSGAARQARRDASGPVFRPGPRWHRVHPAAPALPPGSAARAGRRLSESTLGRGPWASSPHAAIAPHVGAGDPVVGTARRRVRAALRARPDCKDSGWTGKHGRAPARGPAAGGQWRQAARFRCLRPPQGRAADAGLLACGAPSVTGIGIVARSSILAPEEPVSGAARLRAAACGQRPSGPLGLPRRAPGGPWHGPPGAPRLMFMYGYQDSITAKIR